ncbi:hypothetical protein PHYSODRAFT_483357 [Phytophthora sojae]|uniref:Uncharacterized protein n=1 Tax=Phytophthora sojae (strain P6497) TaxID=1094619 RepID=G4YYZ4_PHYSP|nr:hypothetical protein PHYSODRAFT_483357 [Phytophthora sojae]EGZ23275.1 hypothetical protein PHYSODRAFT_483357 [Phytophthora sojae]|eukprot:XP_009518563.1 hypothetical protein PHYSODRAFT_483357 [Phytophthora sojae]
MSSLKPERFARKGSGVVFQDEDFQRRTREKILLLVKEVSDANTPNNALIARKVIKYRKLTSYRVTQCV